MKGYIEVTTITNIFYIIRKTEGREVALAAIKRLLIGLQFCAVDRQIVEIALNLELIDFEDSVQCLRYLPSTQCDRHPQSSRLQR